jgi:hypothetical protein
MAEQAPSLQFEDVPHICLPDRRSRLGEALTPPFHSDAWTKDVKQRV